MSTMGNTPDPVMARGRIPLPAAALAAQLDLDGSKLVSHLFDEIAGRLPEAREAVSREELQAIVRGFIEYYDKHAPDDDRTPFYLLVPRSASQSDLNMQHIWNIAAEVVPREFAGMRVVRLTGGKNPVDEQIEAQCLAAMLKRR